MASIELRGKYAVGEHRHAVVDDEDFPALNQWAWKAKWNGGRNNIYAVRNERIAGKSVTIRMHRAILGLQPGDPREVDHRDHFGLNNQRSNLRIASRSENILNARRTVITVQCGYCGVSAARQLSATGVSNVSYCSELCASNAQAAPHSAVSFPFCRGCNRRFTARQRDAFWCGEACRHRSKRASRLSQRQRILLALDWDNARTPKQIAKLARAHESDVRRLLADLAGAGVVVARGFVRTNERGRPATSYLRSS